MNIKVRKLKRISSRKLYERARLGMGRTGVQLGVLDMALVKSQRPIFTVHKVKGFSSVPKTASPRLNWKDFIPNRTALKRFAAAFMIFGMLQGAGLNETVSYFLDAEGSAGNTATAGTLNFDLSSATNFSPNISATQNAVRTATISNAGILDFNYTITTTNETGDLCGKLDLKAATGSAASPTSDLTSFSYAPGTFSSVGGNWTFTASLKSGATDWGGKTCNFDIVFEGRQIGMTSPSGFFDTETITGNTVTSESSQTCQTWTTQADFASTTRSSYVDISASPGDAQLTTGVPASGTATLRPNAAGDVKQLSNYGGSDNYASVDESSSDSDTTYVYSAASTEAHDLYNLGDTTQTGTISSVVVHSSMRQVTGSSSSSGPNNAGTGADVTGVGTVTWSSLGNIISDNNSYVTASVGAGADTHYLQATNYGFNIPANATIVGIQATIGRKTDSALLGTNRDNVVRLVKGGSITGDNKAVTGTEWPSSEGAASYGGTSDLWGTTWAVADINASNFGVALSAHNNNWLFTSKTASVDYMNIAVYYSMPVAQGRTYIKTNGNEYPGSWNSLNTTYTDYPPATYPVNPKTGLPWTWAEVNALQAGVSFQNATGEARATQVWVEVNYSTITYNTPGTLESQKFNAGDTAIWQSLEWAKTLPSGTDITLEAATSSNGSVWSGWYPVPTSSTTNLSGLAQTQYIKWKATLTATDISHTPVLNEVKVCYALTGQNAWVQTTQADFDAGAKSSVVTTNNAGGEVQLNSSTATAGNTTTGSTNYPTTNVGYTSTGTDSNAKNYFIVDKYVTTVPLTAIQIKTWGNAGGAVKVSIYDHDATNDLPEHRLFSEIAQTVSNGSWTTFTITNIYLPIGTYWIAMDMATDNGIRSQSSGSTIRRLGYALAETSGFPNPAPNSGFSDLSNRPDCIYFVGVPVEGYAKATKVSLSNNANITSLSFYSHATGNFRLALYANNSGAPGARLWESGSTAATASAWNAVNISSGAPTSLSLVSGTYWLAWQWDSANAGPSYTAGSSGDGNYIVQSYGSFPTTWTGGTSSSERWSIYASYPSYATSGTLESQIFDRGAIADWQSLEWKETLPANTDINIAVATSNDGATWSAWQLSSGTSPISLASLPETRYIKWKATLSTTDTNQTPVLYDVKVSYLPGAASQHIVLNEFLPNPSGLTPNYGFDFGEDGDSKPKGEWVEIYNKAGGKPVDLAGWYIKNQAGNIVNITSSNTNNGSTVIGANGTGNEWLVVYMNQAFLDNGGDTVKLYDMFDNLIDSHSYDASNFCTLQPTLGGTNNGDTPSGSCLTVPGNKSFARIPDGIGAWVDPIPTPGEANILEEDSITPVETDQASTTPKIASTTDESISTDVVTSTESVIDTTNMTDGTDTASVAEGTDGNPSLTLPSPGEGDASTTVESAVDENASGTPDSISSQEGVDGSNGVDGNTADNPSDNPSPQPSQESSGGQAPLPSKGEGVEQQPAILPNPDQTPAIIPEAIEGNSDEGIGNSQEAIEPTPAVESVSAPEPTLAE